MLRPTSQFYAAESWKDIQMTSGRYFFFPDRNLTLFTGGVTPSAFAGRHKGEGALVCFGGNGELQRVHPIFITNTPLFDKDTSEFKERFNNRTTY